MYYVQNIHNSGGEEGAELVFFTSCFPAVPGTPQYVDEQFLSRLFLFVALVIMFWLLIA